MVRFFSGRFPFISTWQTYMLVKFEQMFEMKWIEGTPWQTALLYLPVTPYGCINSSFGAHFFVRTSAGCLSPIMGLELENHIADKYNCISYKQILVRMDFNNLFFKKHALLHSCSCNLFPRHLLVILVPVCQKPSWPVRGKIFLLKSSDFFFT